jgi:hypothetical protein
MSMKRFSTLFIAVLAFSITAIGQYTPLPPLDEVKYQHFVTSLRTEADNQGLFELWEVADNMTYNEARYFLAYPHEFVKKLKEKGGSAEEKTIDPVRLGIIIAVLMNHLTNLGDWESSPKIGYALGMYAMFTLGNVYFLTELLYTYRSAGEKSSSYSHTISLSYITVFATMMYAIQMQTIRWLIGAGPVFGFGIGGKEKNESGSSGSESDAVWGDDGFSRFQAGLTLATGFMFARGMMVYLTYSLFFTRLYSNDSDVRMNMFRLALGIPLNKG